MFSVGWLLLIAVAPVAWGWQPHAIISGSMQSAIHVGDIVVIDPGVPKGLKPGQVMSFKDPNRPDHVMTHRLVAKNENGTWQTKGDANPTPDSAPLRTADIVGKPRILVPWLGMLSYWVYAGQTGYAIGIAALIVTLAWFGVSALFRPAPPAPPKVRAKHAAKRTLRHPFGNPSQPGPDAP